MMTNAEKIQFALLMVKYLTTNPLSHAKRNLLHEILGSILEGFIGQLAPAVTDTDDIPF